MPESVNSYKSYNPQKKPTCLENITSIGNTNFINFISDSSKENKLGATEF